MICWESSTLITSISGLVQNRLNTWGFFSLVIFESLHNNSDRLLVASQAYLISFFSFESVFGWDFEKLLKRFLLVKKLRKTLKIIFNKIKITNANSVFIHIFLYIFFILDMSNLRYNEVYKQLN